MTERFLRRAAGLLLIALASLLPIHVYVRLSAWDAQLADRTGVSRSTLLEVIGGGAGIWLIVAAGLWWHWRRMTMWRVWARWAAFPGLFLALIQCVRIAADRGKPVALAIGAGLAAGCWVISELVRLVTTRPVTSTLINSTWEITYPTRELRARLCIREDRLLIDSLVSRRKRSRDVVAVPWSTLRSIELINLEQEMTCTIFLYSATKKAKHHTFDVRPGPALHVIGTARELLIPVTEEVGRAALAAVETRSAGIELDETPLTVEDWCREAGVPLYDSTIYRVRLRRGQYVRNYSTDKRPYYLTAIAGFLLMPLYMLTMITAALVSGSTELQSYWGVAAGLDKQEQIVIAGLGIVAVVFLYLLQRFVIRGFRSFMEGQNFIEAFPEPPPPPPKTGTVPGSGKKRKKR